MAGGYTNVIAIPIDDPDVKAITGALITPEGAGPFPAVIYMGGCAGLDFAPDRALQASLVERMRAKGFATLVVDPFTARGETSGICDAWSERTYMPLGLRGAKDMWGAFNLLKARPEIDARHIFIEGVDYGGEAALFATANPGVAAMEVKPAGVIAFDPYCGFSIFPVPTLAFVGEKGGVYATVLCQARLGRANLDLVLYPNATHGFAWPGMDGRLRSAHMVYDPKAAADAETRIDAFIAAHMKEAATH
jgi:dienelactone hydrolase